MTYFEVLRRTHWDGKDIGNTIMKDFYANRVNGGSEMQFARLAIFLEWKYGITRTKEIKTEHIYELLSLFLEHGFKPKTISGYISAYRSLFRWNPQLFNENFAIPSENDFRRWLDENRK